MILLPQRRCRKSPVELLYFSRSVRHRLFSRFSHLRVQPTNLLPTGMEIVSDETREASFLPSFFVLKRRITKDHGAFILIQLGQMGG